MAKENYISLRGQLRKDPTIVTDDMGEPISAVFSLHTLKRNVRDRAGNLDPKFDRPIILTSDPRLVQKIKSFKNHDIIEVKGNFTTGFVQKPKKCPVCGEVNIIETPFQVVTPLYVGVIRTGIENDAEGLHELVETAEISNIAKMIGRVCSPTDHIYHGVTEIEQSYTKYQLAVNRKYYMATSNGYEDHTDYPYVISYEDVADKDYAALKQGALVYIDGYIHTMAFNINCKCEHCGSDFTFRSQRMLITPYSTEYLRDYNDDAIPETRANAQEMDIDGGGGNS